MQGVNIDKLRDDNTFKKNKGKSRSHEVEISLDFRATGYQKSMEKLTSKFYMSNITSNRMF